MWLLIRDQVEVQVQDQVEDQDQVKDKSAISYSPKSTPDQVFFWNNGVICG